MVKLNALIILRETRCCDIFFNISTLSRTVVPDILAAVLVKSCTSYFRLFKELHTIVGYHTGQHKYRIHSLLGKVPLDGASPEKAV